MLVVIAKVIIIATIITAIVITAAITTAAATTTTTTKAIHFELNPIKIFKKYIIYILLAKLLIVIAKLKAISFIMATKIHLFC